MKKKILVCDDHPAILEVTDEILKNNGFEVVICASGETLIQDIENSQPDLAMIDLRMPQKPGDAITKEIRQHERLKNLPVIIFSANHKGETQSMDAGADAFLCKPFEIDELISTINQCIGKRSE